MNRLRQLDDQLFIAINSFARHTPGLHAPFLAYAKYGLALFALLLLAGVLIARRDQARVLAAAGWACVANERGALHQRASLVPPTTAGWPWPSVALAASR